MIAVLAEGLVLSAAATELTETLISSRLATCLDGFSAAFSRANADAIVHRKNEDFAIANFAVFTAAAAFQNGIDGGLHEFFVHADLQLHFAKQADAVVAASHGSGLASLSAKPLAIHDRQAVHLHAGQCLFDGIQFGRLDDCDDQFHGRCKSEVASRQIERAIRAGKVGALSAFRSAPDR